MTTGLPAGHGDAVVAGVDSSTQATKVALYRVADGRPLAVGSAPHPPTYPPTSQQPPDRWWDALVQAFRSACEAADVAPSRVEAISVGAQCHGMTLLDARGESLRDAILWNDLRSAEEAGRLDEATGGWFARTGTLPTASITITKLMWVLAHEPEVLEATRHVLLPMDYLTWRLTGELVTEPTAAAGTGYYRAPDGRWDLGLLRELVSPERDWARMLPRVVGSAEPAGRLTPTAAAALGARPGIVVGSGGSDQALATMGLGLVDSGTYVSLGTSAVILAPKPHWTLDPQGRVENYVLATPGYLSMAVSLNGTKVTDLFAHFLGTDVRSMAAEARAAYAAGDHGPLLAAFIDGERTPPLPWASGVLTGLRSSTTRGSLALSAFEGVVLGLAGNRAALVDSGADVGTSVVVGGGGAASDLYLQLLADYCEADVVRTDVEQATARGAAIQAYAALAGLSTAEVTRDWRPRHVDRFAPGDLPAERMRAYRSLVGLVASRQLDTRQLDTRP